MTDGPRPDPIEVLRFERFSAEPDLVRVAEVVHAHRDQPAVLDYARPMLPERWMALLIQGHPPHIPPEALQRDEIRLLYLGQRFHAEASSQNAPRALIQIDPRVRPETRYARWTFPRAELYRVEASHEDFSGADFSGARLEACVFVGTCFVGSTFWRSTLVRCEWIDAPLSGAHFWGATLEACRFVRADLRQANFRNAALEQLQFEETRYDQGTLWPDGFQPEAHAGLIFERSLPGR